MHSLRIVDKYVIAFDESQKTYYINSWLFNITESDWFTDSLSEIKNEYLFDNYKDAENFLYDLANRHRLLAKTNLHIQRIKRVEELE